MTIAATLSYRALADYVSGSTDMYDIIPCLIFFQLTMANACVASRTAPKLIVVVQHRRPRGLLPRRILSTSWR